MTWPLIIKVNWSRVRFAVCIILPGDMVRLFLYMWYGARIICDRVPDQYDSNVGFCRKVSNIKESQPHHLQ